MVKEELADLGIKSVLKMLHSNPEKAIPRLLKIINIVGKKLFPSQLKIINEYMSGPDKNVYQLVMRALNQINPDVLDNILMNFYFNVNVKGWAKQNELRAKYQCNNSARPDQRLQPALQGLLGCRLRQQAQPELRGHRFHHRAG